ncbi:hypothetical protein Nepgr_022903 [Nepenthes gracilis]|uniref:WPP domain-associated protein n=1 Tax=Nepenthes gracilis TaxID=150966 RepID=A0AAD3XYV1_NEPGR|nr:hypothetical protein Nepgr_022903 [Nepenthes gracilis]
MRAIKIEHHQHKNVTLLIMMRLKPRAAKRISSPQFTPVVWNRRRPLHSASCGDRTAMKSVEVSQNNEIRKTAAGSGADGLFQLSKGSVQERENVVLQSSCIRENAVGPGAEEPFQLSMDNIEESGSVGDKILHDLDSYLQDINDRLTISRMVSDSVIKGMMNAVSQDAAEMVAAKELQVAGLKEELRLHQLVNDEWNMSNASLCERQLEGELQKEIISLVMQNIIQSLWERCKTRPWNQNVDFYGNGTGSWIGLFEEISSLRQEFDEIQKDLSGLENAQLCSQGSLEMDCFLRKVLGNHASPPGSVGEGNDELQETTINMPENLEFSQLNHMSKEELYNYFRVMITKMKRDHESDVQKMTEYNFSLKRELLKERELSKERGSFPQFKKEKHLDILKSKIPEVILKLDGILMGKEKFQEICEFSRNRLDSLLSENLSLKDLLIDKEREIEYLSSKVSDATEKKPHHSLVEANFYKLVGDFSSVEDAHAEASISQDVYKIIFRELVFHHQCDDEEADVRYAIMQEILAIIYVDAFDKAETIMKQECSYISDTESLIKQGISGVVFQEVLKDMVIELKNWKTKCLLYDELVVSFKFMASGMEKSLQMELEEKKKLMHQIAALEAIVEEKDKTLHGIRAALEKEREQSELANKELTKMMARASKQEALLIQIKAEQEIQKTKLEDYLQQIDLCKREINNLTENLDQERARFLAVSEEMNDILLLVKANHWELMKHLESLVQLIQVLSKAFADFELKVEGSIKGNSLRLENSTAQLHYLVQKANVLRRTGLLYKQRLEMRCIDLQKAEAEVDLLGDQVDSLLSILEKIYIALDHYSPILEHYPGITEILKLVKRELSGASAKAV